MNSITPKPQAPSSGFPAFRALVIDHVAVNKWDLSDCRDIRLAAEEVLDAMVDGMEKDDATRIVLALLSTVPEIDDLAVTHVTGHRNSFAGTLFQAALVSYAVRLIGWERDQFELSNRKLALVPSGDFDVTDPFYDPSIPTILDNPALRSDAASDDYDAAEDEDAARENDAFNAYIEAHEELEVAA